MEKVQRKPFRNGNAKKNQQHTSNFSFCLTSLGIHWKFLGSFAVIKFEKDVRVGEDEQKFKLKFVASILQILKKKQTRNDTQKNQLFHIKESDEKL